MSFNSVPSTDLMQLALAESRILLTEDKDCGWLVFAAHMDSSGVILIRFPASARGTLVAAVRRLVAEQGRQLLGAFVVVRPGSARIGTKPPRA